MFVCLKRDFEGTTAAASPLRSLYSFPSSIPRRMAEEQAPLQLPQRRPASSSAMPCRSLCCCLAWVLCYILCRKQGLVAQPLGVFTHTNRCFHKLSHFLSVIKLKFDEYWLNFTIKCCASQTGPVIPAENHEKSHESDGFRCPDSLMFKSLP